VEHVPEEKFHSIFSVSRPNLTITAKFLIFYSDPEEEGGGLF